MSHGSSKLYKSTLLNETGRVELYRVSEETAKRVEAESKVIRDRMTELNRLSRINVRKDENRKIREREQQRKSMINKWVEASKHSPFLQDNAAIEDRRQQRVEEQEYRKRVEGDRNKLVDSMIGTSKFDVCNSETIRLFDEDPEVKLALSLRRVVKDKHIVQHERNTLDQLLDTSFAELRHKFPDIAFDGEDHSLAKSSRVNSSTTSLREGPPGHKRKADKPSSSKRTGGAATTPGKQPTSTVSAGKQPSAAVSAESSQMSGGSSLYHAPQLNPESFGMELDNAFNC